MQQLIDCTVLCTHTVKDWAGRWTEGLADDKLRIRMAYVAVDTGTAGGDAMREVVRAKLVQSHLCLLPVCPGNVSWVRMLLGQTVGVLPVPVMAVSRGLKAVALRDLLTLGVVDFIGAPGCHDELRVRVERVLDQARTAQLDTLSGMLGTMSQGIVTDTSYRGYDGHPDGRLKNTDTETVVADTRNKAWCGRAVRTYAMGRLVPRAPRRVMELSRLSQRQADCVQPWDASVRRTTTACDGLALEAFAAATATRCALHDEPFKQAKVKVVEGFEKAYLVAALNRYGGNIAQAARAAKKHRRAFWELVRKHRIDLAQYRVQGQAQGTWVKPALPTDPVE